MTTATLQARATRVKSHTLVMPNIPWKLLYWLSAVAFLFLVILYVFQINRLTEGAYLIKKYNKQLVGLVADNKMLQANFAENSFLGQAKDEALGLNFEKTTEVSYLQIMNTSLAKADVLQ